MKKLIISLAICLFNSVGFAHPQDVDSVAHIPAETTLTAVADINLLPNAVRLEMKGWDLDINPEHPARKEDISCAIHYKKSYSDRVIKTGTTYRLTGITINDRSGNFYSYVNIKIDSETISSIVCYADPNNPALVDGMDVSIGLLKYALKDYFSVQISAPLVVR